MSDRKVAVVISKQKEKFENIDVNFIGNRFDLQKDRDAYVCEVCKGDRTQFIPFCIQEDECVLGISFAQLSGSTVAAVCRNIFKQFKNVNKIVYKNGLRDVGLASAHNYFVVPLPATYRELSGRLSAKGRYNISREKKIIQKELGDFAICEYSRDQISDELIGTYFAMKEQTHGTDYHMTPKQYVQRYDVTDAYTLEIGNEVLAVVFSCEQCPNVYLENLSYRAEYAKYSPGKILYDEFLKRLIERKKESLFLAGGDLNYKKRYGSVELTVYDGVISRNACKRLLDRLITLYRHVRSRCKGRT